MAKRYVLIDRDGTLNVEKNYLSDPAQLELYPGAGEALRRLQAAGFGIVVVTNQSGIARGYFDLATLDRVHDRLRAILAGHGVTLDGIFLCPHGPDDDCRCRKPLPGMVEQAVAALGFDPAEAVMIGDKKADIGLGKGVGATAILVRTGYGAETEARGGHGADHVVDGLAQAADLILALDATARARLGSAP